MRFSCLLGPSQAPDLAVELLQMTRRQLVANQSVDSDGDSSGRTGE